MLRVGKVRLRVIFVPNDVLSLCGTMRVTVAELSPYPKEEALAEACIVRCDGGGEQAWEQIGSSAEWWKERKEEVAVGNARGVELDIGGLLEGAPESRRRAAHRALASALLEEDSPGFFYAQHAPATLDAAYLESVYAFVDEAHALEAHVKYPFADPDRGSGELGVAYNGPDVGHLEPSYDGESVSAACAWDYSPHGVARQAPGWDRHLPRRFAATFADLYGRQNAVGRAVHAVAPGAVAPAPPAHGSHAPLASSTHRVGSAFDAFAYAVTPPKSLAINTASDAIAAAHGRHQPSPRDGDTNAAASAKSVAIADW